MNDPNKVAAPKVFMTLAVLAIVPLMYFGALHAPYYSSARIERPLSPDHPLLRSSGYCGLTFGAIGTFLIILNLSYLVRRESPRLKLGHLRSWVAFHVATGLTAYVLILLHSDFLLRSALGTLALGGFTIVVFTGIVGRWIYAHTPRNLEGSELEMDEVRKRLKGYKKQLEALGTPKELLATDLDEYKVVLETKSLLGSIWGMVRGDQKLRQTYANAEATIKKTEALRPKIPEIMPLAKIYFKELEWLSRFHELRGVMGSWRFFHRWLAISMVCAVLFHVTVAEKMGHLWLFHRAGWQAYWASSKTWVQHIHLPFRHTR